MEQRDRFPQRQRFEPTRGSLNRPIEDWQPVHRIAMVLLLCCLGLDGSASASFAAEPAEIAVVRLTCGAPADAPPGAFDTGCEIGGVWNRFPFLAIGENGLPGGEGGFAPTWSPDGSQIAFTRYLPHSGDPQNSEIFVVPTSGGTPINLTNHPAQDWSPAWSSDGTKIAFASNRDGPSEIYIMNVDGLNPVRLTVGSGLAGYPSWFGSWLGGSRLAWSPDGARIVFDCTFEMNNFVYWNLCVVNADGTGLMRLTDHPGADIGPAWSPDGTKIAFASDRSGELELHLVNPDGSSVQKIGGGIAGAEPAWSPDGTRIAFSRFMDPACEDTACVWVVNADGTGPLFATVGSSPAWKPTGELDPDPIVPGPPPVIPEIGPHVADLDASSTGQTGGWKATVGVTIHDGSHNVASKARVSGVWSNGAAGSCTTNGKGRCSFSQSGIDKMIETLTFTILDVSHATLTYTPVYNHDPDGDSDGHSIVVHRPNMHVADVSASSAAQTTSWTAKVNVVVHTDTHTPAGGARVRGSWSDGSTTTCKTNKAGRCIAARSGIPKATDHVTFTLLEVTHPRLTYKPIDNHGFNGNSILVIGP